LKTLEEKRPTGAETLCRGDGTTVWGKVKISEREKGYVWAGSFTAESGKRAEE